MIIIWIIVAIFIFSLVIIIHEFGHFFVARKTWVKVLEFGLWIPPKAKEIFTDKKWTRYTLNWLPLWGFVRLNWETPPLTPPPSGEGDKFYNKSYLEKTAILLAWVFMNFLLASVIFSVLFFIWIKPIWINDKIPTNLNSKIIPTYSQAISDWIIIKKDWLILNPIKWSLAEKAWIKNWDILLEIATCKNKFLNYWFCSDKNWKLVENNFWIFTKTNNFKDLKKILNINKEKTVIFYYLGEQYKKTNEYDSLYINIPKDWKIWAYIWENIELNRDFEYKFWIIDSVKYWFKETYIQSVLTFKWLWILMKKIFSPEKPEDRQEALNQMSWPIWIVDFVSTSIWAWIVFLSIITAIISINLWIFNLLPIPALDWWRWFLLTINTILKQIFWEKIQTENFENLVHILFFIILIALSILIWYNDIIKIINR